MRPADANSGLEGNKPIMLFTQIMSRRDLASFSNCEPVLWFPTSSARRGQISGKTTENGGKKMHWDQWQVSRASFIPEVR